MAIVWNNRNDWFNSSTANGGDSFQEHNQLMRAFHLAHPENWRQWGHRIPEVQGGLLALASIGLIWEGVPARYSQN